jgi:hypothetical protein
VLAALSATLEQFLYLDARDRTAHVGGDFFEGPKGIVPWPCVRRGGRPATSGNRERIRVTLETLHRAYAAFKREANEVPHVIVLHPDDLARLKLEFGEFLTIYGARVVTSKGVPEETVYILDEMDTPA